MSVIVVYLLIGLGYTLANVNAFRMSYRMVKFGAIPTKGFDDADLETVRQYEAKLREAINELSPSLQEVAVWVVLLLLVLRSVFGWPVLLFRKIKANKV